MDNVPAYLVVQLVKVRKHMDRDGALDDAWLKARFAARGPQRAMELALMLHELADLHLVGFAAEEEEMVYVGGEFRPHPPDQRPAVLGTEVVMRPRQVHLFPRGRWLWTELLSRAALWLLTSAVGALVGTVATSLALGVR